MRWCYATRDFSSSEFDQFHTRNVPSFVFGGGVDRLTPTPTANELALEACKLWQLAQSQGAEMWPATEAKAADAARQAQLADGRWRGLANDMQTLTSLPTAPTNDQANAAQVAISDVCTNCEPLGVSIRAD